MQYVEAHPMALTAHRRIDAAQELIIGLQASNRVTHLLLDVRPTPRSRKGKGFPLKSLQVVNTTRTQSPYVWQGSLPHGTNSAT